jgi:glycosyltransferase involved in cell wall biosynthesis
MFVHGSFRFIFTPLMRKKILWLCSWYPNKTDPFDGDFVQRHARAAAMYNDIYVIRVAPDENAIATNSSLTETTKTGGLTEHIVYFKKTNSIAGRISAAIRWRALYKAAIKQYINGNGKPDLIHVHIPMKAGLLALWMKRKYNIPFIVTEHWTVYQPNAPVHFSKRSHLFRRLTRKIIDEAALLITVSKDLGEKIQDVVLKKTFQVVANVADTRLFYYRPHSREKFVFIHVSNMSPQKNISTIVAAFHSINKELADTELVIVGPPTEELGQAVKTTGLLNRSIHLTGEINYAAVAEQLQASSALVLASSVENQPCVIIEALCSGLPVISTAVGGIPEIINEENGLLVHSSVTALTQAMKQMIGSYSKFSRAKIATEAAKQFSYEIVGSQLDKIYRSLVNPSTA